MEAENDGFQKETKLFKGVIFRFYVCFGGVPSLKLTEST